MSAAMLRADRLCLRIGPVAILTDLSFTVRAGEVVGVIGPNGAGKTTAVEIVSGFRAPTSGDVFLEERSIVRLSPSARVRAGLTRTFQESPYVEGLTVFDHVRLAHASAGRATASIHALLDRVGLRDRQHATGPELSMGERRMLDLARALACAPRVLLLDEPFAALSGDQEALLHAAIRSHAAGGGGVLIIEHRLSLLGNAADTVIALVQGTCVAAGSMQQVLDHTIVKSAYLGHAV